MKTTKATREARRSISVSGQLFNLIPPHLIGELAQRHAIHARRFEERSHVFALMLCQIAHAPFKHRLFAKAAFPSASAPQVYWSSCVGRGEVLQPMGW